ncbi:piggyBac transposable element-derived protein 4-like [Ptychodera flava]|uniref:piggyBac transposable element-derived protein 4-like n=1 Tax=Ptychodera flava TaxID=63121 RepID=UPI00396A523C
MIPYAGKGEQIQHGLGYSVVVDLTSRYFGMGHHLYYDNFFSSLRLAVDLLNRRTYVCSTVRKNSKGLPPAVSKSATKLKPGDYVYRKSGEIIATLWHDKRDVTLLSTNCNPGGVEIQRKGKEMFVPTVVRKYNSFMGGVDLSDQMASYYPINNKYMKFWKYLFWFFIDRMIINAFILYSIAHSPNPNRRYRQKDYRLDLSSQLIGGFTSRRKRGPQSQVTELENSINIDNIANHSCEVLSPNAKRKKKCCRQCSKTGKKTPKGYPVETTWGCKQCNVYLCKSECFLQYHASILRR